MGGVPRAVDAVSDWGVSLGERGAELLGPLEGDCGSVAFVALVEVLAGGGDGDWGDGGGEVLGQVGEGHGG